ncbi:MAG TPA: ABC transporter substrate-binding protein [Alphaproteobacteria bacterium]|nr:ABC transporter substrate-binding protein [Alphaproteobacteria bacterium]
MKSKTRVFGATLGVALMATVAAGPVTAKETITYAYLLDPALEGVLYAIKTGKVTSKTVEIKASALAIPALIQSTPAKRFDVIMNAVMAIPFAKKRGLELVVLSTALRSSKGRLGAGIWVKKSSPYKTLADLKGKTMGNYALRSTGTTWVRIALWKKHGINVSYKNGDFKWVQIQAPALLPALASGRIDAATLIHAQAYKALKSGDYRVLAWTNRDIKELFGIDSVAAVNVTYPEKLAKRPAAFREFNRMLRASVLYAVKNPDEVGKAISAKYKISPDYFKAWMADYSFFPGAVSDEDMKAMEVVWSNAKEMGIIQKVPKAADVVWKDAIRE